MTDIETSMRALLFDFIELIFFIFSIAHFWLKYQAKEVIPAYQELVIYRFVQFIVQISFFWLFTNDNFLFQMEYQVNEMIKKYKSQSETFSIRSSRSGWRKRFKRRNGSIRYIVLILFN